ncbi:NHL repeat-containing protein [Gaopeijia maritima]|uniref:6-bladed beta-propeller n=1 Tax=Gaopeijia maritima TaxID=3119007 RepID=A0ABU9ECZ6_9BACT
MPSVLEIRWIMRPASLLVVVAAACVGEPDSSPWSVADSAGVRVVEIAVEPVALPVYASVGELEFTVGSIDGTDGPAFGDVGEVRSLPGGDVLVTESRSQTVGVYDRSGRTLARMGGRGDGPGEFRFLHVAGVAGDTLWIWDPIPQRLTPLSRSGRVWPVVTFEHELADRPGDLRRLADGGFVARTRFQPLDPLDPKYAESKVWTDSLVLRRLDAEGLEIDTIAIAAAEQLLREIWPSPTGEGDGRPVGAMLPFGTQAHWAIDSIGNSVVVDGTSGQMVLRDVRGSIRTVVRFASPPRPLPEAEVERLRRSRLDDVESSPFRPMVERVFSKELLPTAFPRVGGLLVGESGTIWVAQYATFPEEVTEWTAFAPDGEPLGRLSLPARFQAREFGEAYVLGAHTDEFGVQRVQRYRLERP